MGVLYKEKKKGQVVFQSICTNVQSCQWSVTALKSLSFPTVDITRVVNFCQSSGIKIISCGIDCISLVSKTVEFHVLLCFMFFSLLGSIFFLSCFFSHILLLGLFLIDS